MERFGAVGDDMQAMVRGACGDPDRDRGEEDWAKEWSYQSIRARLHHALSTGVHIHEYYSGGFCCPCQGLRVRLCMFACLRVCMSAPPQAVQRGDQRVALDRERVVVDALVCTHSHPNGPHRMNDAACVVAKLLR
eukprot:7135474-Prymnesium_polylepis.1